MKTLVLQLDHTEDTGSIRDKVTWGKASRVLLVWPVNYPVFERKIDLVAIKRICSAQGSRLGIVCDHAEVIAEAEILQIPVFVSVNRAMRKSWDKRHGRREVSTGVEISKNGPLIEDLRVEKSVNHGFIKLNKFCQLPVFFLGVAAVFVLLLFLYPSAYVIIHPKGRLEMLELDFNTRESSGNSPFPSTISVVKRTFVLKGETIIPTTGNIQVAENKAVGEVTITNLGLDEINIPSKTILKSNMNPTIRYLILEGVSIPSEESVEKIKIEALEAGIAGNANENSFFSLDGEKDLQVEITNSAPIQGGSGKQYQAVSENDVKTARNKIIENTRINVFKKLSTTLQQDEIALDSSIVVKDFEELSIQPGLDQIGNNLSLEGNVEYTVLVFNQANLRQQAEIILDANQPVKGWLGLAAGSVNLKIISQKYDSKTEIVSLKVSVSKEYAPPIDTNDLRVRIAGKSKSTASEIINQVVLNQAPPIVEVFPEFWPFLPFLSSRIQLGIQ